MTAIESISVSLHLYLAMSLLWVLVFYFWRQYRLDSFRESLFRIRGELFDYAASGAVSFDDPAYAKLRVLMNGMIRYAHRFTFFRIAMFILFRRVLGKADSENLLAQWERSLQNLPAEKQRRLRELHDRMLGAIVWHMTTGSPVLFPVFCFYMLRSILRGTSKRLDRDEVNKVGKELPCVDVVEAQAISAELEEEERPLEPVPV